MAVRTLLTISKDEIMRNKIFQEEKRMQDAISDKISAIKLGEAKGREEGIEIGREEGIEVGRKEMAVERSIEIAKNLISLDLPNEDISKATGLSISEIEELRG